MRVRISAMINIQKHLLFLTDCLVRQNQNSYKIRGVTAEWEDGITAHISFYFDGELEENELEDASITCTEIIAQIPESLLKEDYIRLDYPTPLPESPFWAFKRPEVIDK